MADFGFQIAQENVDIRRAADYQKTLDSRWRTLDAVFEVEVEVVHGGSGDTMAFHHKLGFLPAFTARKISGSGEVTWWADRQKVYVRGDAGTYSVFLRIYDVDPTVEYRAPVLHISARPGSSASKIGAKFLNQHRTSQGMRDDEKSHYSLNTQAKAMGIQQTGVVEATVSNGHELVITHDLGYPPTYLTAEMDLTDTSNPKIAVMGNVLGRVTANSVQVRIVGALAVLLGSWAYLVLKDPIEVAA